MQYQNANRICIFIASDHISVKARLEFGRGLCFVRARQGDEIVLTTYGRSSGFCVDPIEKKPLNHFLARIASALVRHRRLQSHLQVLPELGYLEGTEFDRLQDEASPKAIAQAAKELGARSVAFTYNDPVIFLEYAGPYV